MKLAKWGNSFAFRVPAELMRKMSFTPDEEFQFRQTGEDSFEVVRDRSREEAIEAIRRLARPLPPGYQFNREEIHEREWMRRLDKERGTVKQ
jgi:antitoxin MazE